MHQIKLLDVQHSEKTLTQAVLQISQMLGIYHAELARILHLQCADIGELANAHKLLTINTEPWAQAEQLINLYEALFIKCNGDEASMNNWLRRAHTKLQGVPLYLMVDELRINDVIEVLNEN